MMHKRMNCFWLILGIAVIGTLLLNGCGKTVVDEGESPVLYEEEQKYISTLVETVDTGSFIWRGKGAGKVLFPVQKGKNELDSINTVKSLNIFEIEEGTIKTLELKYSDDPKVDFSINIENFLLGAGINKNGDILGLLKQTEDGNNKDFYLVAFDVNGNEVERINISDQLKDLPAQCKIYNTHVMVADDGNLYLVIADNQVSYIYSFDKNGNKRFDSSVPGYVSAADLLDDDKIVLFSSCDNDRLYLASTINGELDLLTNPLSDLYCNGIWADEGTNAIYYLLGDQIFKYDIQDKINETMTRLSEMDQDSDSACGLIYKGDEQFYILSYEAESSTVGTGIYLASKSEVPSDTRNIITFAVFGDSSNIKNLALRYNKKSNTTKIEIKEYESSDLEGIDETFLTDVSAGIIPDIIDIAGSNAIDYVQKGMLCDLKTLLDNDPDISESDFLKSALNAYCINEKLYGIPVRFNVSTLVGPKNEFKDCVGWNIDVFKEKLSQNGKISCVDASRSEVFGKLLLGQLGRFVDVDSKSCDFNNAEFKNFLEFIMLFPEKSEIGDMSDLLSLVKEGNIKLLVENTNAPEQFLIDKMIFSNDICYVGYPSVSGTGSFLQVMGSDVYGITNNCSDKKAAWDFLKYVYKNGDYLTSFPTYLENLDKELEFISTPNYSLDSNGEKIEVPISNIDLGDVTLNVYAASKEDVDDIKQMLDTAEPASAFDLRMASIIYEEAEPFLKGEKGLDDTVSIIQNRVSLYLKE